VLAVAKSITQTVLSAVVNPGENEIDFILDEVK